jgi:hypothetical protein
VDRSFSVHVMTELHGAPTVCALPTIEQPLREREFGDLFASSLRGDHQLTPTRTDLTLEPASETRARNLAARESSCCSFFTFAFESASDSVTMRITVPEQHATVLEALVAAARRDAGLNASAGAA